jgi:hypothetical protein
MKTEFESPNPDPALSSLLRETMPRPALPPRFAQSVWQRIERAEAAAPERSRSWLDLLASLVLRPRFALATVTVVMMAGALLGFVTAGDAAREAARASYVAAVNPLAKTPPL